MINNAIYSFWSNKGETSCGFCCKPHFINFLNESVTRTKKFFKNVIIYTDNHGYEMLNPHIDCEYVIFDFDSYEYTKYFWNYPKLLTYAAQKEPFLHIDTDIILYDKPDTNMYTADFVCERYHVDKWTRNSKLFSNLLYHTDKIYTSGIFGGNNLKLFDILLKSADYYIGEVIEDIKNGKLPDFPDLVSIEELSMTNIIETQFLNKNGKQFNIYNFSDYYNNLLNPEIKSNRYFAHLYGTNKREIHIDDDVIFKLNLEGESKDK